MNTQHHRYHRKAKWTKHTANHAHRKLIPTARKNIPGVEVVANPYGLMHDELRRVKKRYPHLPA